MRRKEHDWTPKALDCSTLQSIADKEFTNRDQAREALESPRRKTLALGQKKAKLTPVAADLDCGGGC